MSGSLSIHNRQRAVMINARLLRRITLALLRDLLQKKEFDLGIILVGAPEMTRLNETFLQHAGSTDVITFDYGNGVPPSGGPGIRADANLPTLLGELFICLDEAFAQARRFRTSWPQELVRYVIHGLLHLNGHDDRSAADRRRMKREENRLLRQLGKSFDLTKLCQTSNSPTVRQSSIVNRKCPGFPLRKPARNPKLAP